MLGRTKNILRSLSIRMRPPSLGHATPRERELIKELRAQCRRLPDRDVSGNSQAENTWAAVLNYFRYLIATEDPRKFLTWDNLQTMVVGNADYVEEELNYLRQRKDWPERWSSAIEESAVGQPRAFTAYPQSSGNLIHHAYHLCRFEEMTSKLVGSFDFVLEFGGGYGSMCRLFHRLGFQGRYAIFDFAEFSFLQQFFLKSLDLPCETIDGFRRKANGIVTISDMAQLEELTAALVPASQKSLFIATWSLSETSLELRRKVLELVSSFDTFLFAYQDRFGEVDNDRFFTDLKMVKPDIQWHQWHIDHVPGNYYLMGQRLQMPESINHNQPLEIIFGQLK